MKLSKTEEKLMELIWRKEKVFLKDLIGRHTSDRAGIIGNQPDQ
ncbi:MAG: hypothetical protein ACOCXH_00635 [Cyclobacteriaceae bacterium]